MRDDESDSSSSSSGDERPIDLRADEEWQDAEPDNEEVVFQSLFDDEIFNTLDSMLALCKQQYKFDLKAVIRNLDLDFYTSIKLVNYIRSEASKGNHKPDVSSKDKFDSDDYLKPILEDDAVLFCLDELLESVRLGATETNGAAAATSSSSETAASKRIQELEEQLQRIQEQFAEYRTAVGETLEKRWDDRSAAPSSGAEKPARDDDTHYFDSYSYNDIHETMLKDTSRTSAYRDFIYDNKHLFADKLVLDVGCGTSILSMFSAKAGARRVVAVDNSSIITKAREIVATNALDSTVTCVRGKIEDVALPLPAGTDKVDILVSEWMGYCLLYEAMLDSVLHARDRYLNPTTGLMVPSHCSLRLAPVADPEYLADTLGFWPDVYGFDMSPMTDKFFDDVLVRTVAPDNVAGDSAVFKSLPLHTITTDDLTFTATFEVVLNKDVDALDGWVIWFDTFFLPDRAAVVPDDAKAETWGKGKGEQGVAFSTGPYSTTTHWQAGLLLIDRGRKKPQELKKGQKISGTIGYSKRQENSRELVIVMSWEAQGTEEKGKQTWTMR